MWFYKDIKIAQDEIEKENLRFHQDMTPEERHQSQSTRKFFGILFIQIFLCILAFTYLFSIPFLRDSYLVNSLIAFMRGIVPTLKVLEMKSTFPQVAQFVYSIILISIPLISIPIRNVLI